MLSRLQRAWGAFWGSSSAKAEARPVPSARLDAARTTLENKKHWAHADALGPIRSAAPGDRKTTRERARYTRDNDCICRGLVLTRANYLVGSGPTFQAQTDDAGFNRDYDAAINEWLAAIRIASKLRTMVGSKTVDGEIFGVHVNNDRLPTSVKLDLRPTECDQVMTPLVVFPSPQHVDGIEYDKAGNPIWYHVLDQHPGDFGFWLPDYKRVRADKVLHWFRRDRPGQPRGISELAPALELFAVLRRFTLATLDAAETAACFAAVLKTMLPPNTDDDQTGEDGAVTAEGFDPIEIVRRMMVTLPEQYEMQQFKAEHPRTTHEMFVMAIIREIARCVNMPLTLALMDSSKSNFSASRLDHTIFRQGIDVERDDCVQEVLDPLGNAFHEEAIRIPKLLPRTTPLLFSQIKHAWHWPPWEYLDPLTDQQAITEGLLNGSLTPQKVAISQGDDWKRAITERMEAEAWEASERKRLGLPDKVVPGAAKQPAVGYSRQNEQPAKREEVALAA